MSFLDTISHGLGTDGSGGGVSGAIDQVGQGVSNAIDQFGHSVGDAWHGISAPFVDTPIGRMALNAGAFALGGPWAQAGMSGALGVNDAANGRSKNNLANLFNVGMGVYGATNSSPTPSMADPNMGPTPGMDYPNMGPQPPTMGDPNVGPMPTTDIPNSSTWSDKLVDAAPSFAANALKSTALSKIPGASGLASLYSGYNGDPSKSFENYTKGLSSLYFDSRNSNLPSPSNNSPITNTTPQTLYQPFAKPVNRYYNGIKTTL